MEEILDDKAIGNKRKIYSILSLISAILALGVITLIFLLIPTTIKVQEGTIARPELLTACFHGFCLFGVVMTIMSFTTKEVSTWYKWVGGVLNLLIFLLIVGSTIFGRIL